MKLATNLEALLKKYHPHISGTVLALSIIVTVGLITPAMLLADELPTTPEYHYQYNISEARPEPRERDTESPQYIKETGNPDDDIEEENLAGHDKIPPIRPNDAEQTAQIKNALMNLRGGYEQFKNQLEKIKKQGLKVPPDVLNSVDKIDKIFSAINDSQSISDLQKSGSANIATETQVFQKRASDLVKISNWKPALKSVDGELSGLRKAYLQDQKIVAAAKTKGLDLTAELLALKNALADLQLARNSSVQSLSKDPAGSYDKLQVNVTQKISEVKVLDATIKTLANVSQFDSEFNKGIDEAEQTLATLSNKKVDTTKLAAALANLKLTGTAVQDQLAQEPLSKSAVSQAVADFVRARQTWQNAKNETLKMLLPPPKKSGPAIDLGVLKGLMAATGTPEQQ